MCLYFYKYFDSNNSYNTLNKVLTIYLYTFTIYAYFRKASAVDSTQGLRDSECTINFFKSQNYNQGFQSFNNMYPLFRNFISEEMLKKIYFIFRWIQKIWFHQVKCD